MVAIILTRSGFEDMRPRINRARDTIWIGDDVLSSAEVDALSATGLNVTVFGYALDPQDLDLDISTVQSEHPGETLWVETVAE